MNCNNLESAMNRVISHILSIYDSGNMNINIAKSIISECIETTSLCSGDISKVLVCFEEQNRCSCCFNKVKEKDLYSANMSNNRPKVVDVLMKHKWFNCEETVGMTICDKCLTKLFEKELK